MLATRWSRSGLRTAARHERLLRLVRWRADQRQANIVGEEADRVEQYTLLTIVTKRVASGSHQSPASAFSSCRARARIRWRQYDVAKQEALAQRSGFEALRTQLQAPAMVIFLIVDQVAKVIRGNASMRSTFALQKPIARCAGADYQRGRRGSSNTRSPGPREALMCAAEPIAPGSGPVWKVSENEIALACSRSPAARHGRLADEVCVATIMQELLEKEISS
jgi:hypothetical protein